MAENKEMEALFEDIRKAIIQIPRRKPIILKNPIIKGIKLSSIMLKHFETNYTMKPSGNFEVEKLMGLQVYRDENADVPRYIVEGELETELQQIKSAEPSEALRIFSKVDNIRLLFTKEERAIIKNALLKQLSGKDYYNIAIDEAEPTKALKIRISDRPPPAPLRVPTTFGRPL